jgi:hypothetical protein
MHRQRHSRYNADCVVALGTGQGLHSHARSEAPSFSVVIGWGTVTWSQVLNGSDKLEVWLLVGKRRAGRGDDSSIPGAVGRP